MKKFFAMMMAGVMTLSMGATVFAGDNTDTHKELVYTGEMQELTVNVVVPTETKLILNPYKLTVEDPQGEEGDTINRQLLTPDSYFFNLSKVALSANVSVQGAVTKSGEGAPTMVTSPIKDTSKAKEVFIFARASAPKSIEATETVYGDLVTAAHETVSATHPESPVYDKTTDLLVGTEAVAKTGMFILPAATYEDDAQSAVGCVSVRLCGGVNDKSTDPWTEEDTVSATFVYDFVPTTTDPLAGAGGEG